MDQDNQILNLYLSEAEQGVLALDRLLSQAESAGELDSAQTAEAFRLIHTLKGSSAMMQYTMLERISHKLEDVFSVLRDKGGLVVNRENHRILDVCFLYSDCFLEQLERIKTGKEITVPPELEKKLCILAASMGKTPAESVEVSNTIPLESVQIPEGSSHFHIRLRRCPMPNVRCLVIMRSVGEMSTELTSFPIEPHQHPEEAERILTSGFDIYAVPREGVTAEQIKERLKVQPLVESVEKSEATGAFSPEDQKEETARVETMVHIPQSRVNSLIASLNELNTTRSALVEALELAGMADSRLEQLLGQLRGDAARAMNLSAEMGMVEIGTVFNQMRRLVRTMAREYGRDIVVETVGNQTPVDTGAIEILSDALIHIVRNAVDHGIEPLERRIAEGKPEQGTITLSAGKANGMICISASDDGGGIDRAAVLKKAFEKNLISEKKETCADSELFDILSAPGFSTNSEVTRYSGRGVGLDTALKRIRDIQGSMSLESIEGQGSTFILRIPSSISLLSVLSVEAENGIACIPVSVVKAVEYASQAVETADAVVYRGREYKRLFLGGMSVDRIDDVYLFFTEEFERYCIRVGNTGSVREMMITPLPRYAVDVLGKRNVFSGCCSEKSGRVLCVLDLYRLIAANEREVRVKSEMKIFDREKRNPHVAAILYGWGNTKVDITIGIRRMMHGYLRELLQGKIGSGETDIGILMTLEETLNGVALFVTETNFFFDLITQVTGESHLERELLEDEEHMSAVQEVAYYLSASCAKAIDSYFRMMVIMSPTMVGIDHVNSLVSFAFENFAVNNESAICVDVSFGVRYPDGRKMNNTSQLIILPDEKTMGRMLKALNGG